MEAGGANGVISKLSPKWENGTLHRSNRGAGRVSDLVPRCSDCPTASRPACSTSTACSPDRGGAAAAWKQMFDEYLRARAERTGEQFVPLSSDDYDAYVDGGRAPTASATSSPPAASRCPRAPPTTHRRRDGPRPGQPQERPAAGDDPRRGRRRRTRARCATWRRRGPRACAAPWSRPAPTAATCSQAAGLEDLLRGPRRRGRRRAGGAARQAGAGHVPARPGSSASSPAQAAVFEDALAGVEAGRAGSFGYVVGVDRVGQADELRDARRRHRGRDLAELLESEVIEPRRVHGRALGVRET